jgi:hypothetical protein
MAKGLRSKDKRANRTKLRQEITIPAMAARQEIIAKRISDDLNKSTGKSLNKLKAVFGQKSTNSKKPETVSKPAEDDIITKGVGENIAKLHKYSKITLPVATKKKIGSKPRNNHNKELVWFGTDSKSSNGSKDT